MDSNGKIVIEGFDWGPAVTKVILNVGSDSEKSGEPDMTLFEVTEIKMNDKKSFSDKRIVTDAYYSDDFGNRSGNKCDFITLELKISPEEGSPMYYDFSTAFNKWFDYKLTVKTGDDTETILNNEDFCFPEINGVDLSGKFTGSEGHTLTYASYRPANASEENLRPLVIWLHGMGEGGTDPLITLYGNKVAALFGEEFQKIMDGAYVLTPQTPTFWMDDGSGEISESPDSLYGEALKALIDEFVEKNPGVDPGRIYIGGDSNGGFMTVRMILDYPDFFAAAFPVCEALPDKCISDEELLKIKDLPVWFTAAKTDTLVPPAEYAEPTYKRLVALGNPDVHFSFWDKIEDLHGLADQVNGKPYEYFGHFSWIPLFNNDCDFDYNGEKVICGGKKVSCLEWLGMHRKGE